MVLLVDLSVLSAHRVRIVGGRLSLFVVSHVANHVGAC